MGKIKQGKRLGVNRDNAAGYSVGGDPMGAKLPLADEIESLKLAKSKRNNDTSTNSNASNNKRQAADEGEEFVDEKMTAKILSQARKQQSELQDEYGIGGDDDGQEDVVCEKFLPSKLNKTSFFINEAASASRKSTSPLNDEPPNFKPFKKLQSNRPQQQKIRKSDHDDSDSDSDTDEQLNEYENKRDFYSDEEIVSTINSFSKRTKIDS